MNWQVLVLPEVYEDLQRAAEWYKTKDSSLPARFVEQVIRVWMDLRENPLLGSRRHPVRNIRWRYPKKFPFKIVYEVDEEKCLVFVVAVLHAARHEDAWRKRFPRM
jgi:plasmid stabilization system protein ParE